MFEKKYYKYWTLLFLSVFCFIMSINTNQVAIAGMAVILLVASNKQCDNKNLQLVSKVLAVIVTLITVLRTFFI